MYKYFIILTISIVGCQQINNFEKPIHENWWLWTVAWSPNEKYIAVGGTQDTLRILSTTNNKLLRNYPLEGTITSIKWHPTKNKLAISTQGGKSKSLVFDLDTQQRIQLDSINDFGARAIDWNNTGELLAIGDYDGMLLIFDEEGRLNKKIATGQKAITGLHWHPTRNLIAAVGDQITLYDFDRNYMQHVEDREEEVLMLSIAWHPDGDLFVTGDYGDYVKNYPALLQFWSAEGLKIKSIEKSKAEYRNVRWSFNGETLATASDKIRLWDKTGRLILEKSSGNLLWGIDWNPEGDKIVTTDEQGIIRIWNQNLTHNKKMTY